MILENVHFFAGETIRVFHLKRFDNGFCSGTVPAAGIRKQEQDVGLFIRSWHVYLQEYFQDRA